MREDEAHRSKVSIFTEGMGLKAWRAPRTLVLVPIFTIEKAY